MQSTRLRSESYRASQHESDPVLEKSPNYLELWVFLRRHMIHVFLLPLVVVARFVCGGVAGSTVWAVSVAARTAVCGLYFYVVCFLGGETSPVFVI